ncbi:MAG: pentapeptide repeat-containing protein, partial [Tepidisphaeraceae bacterium]
ADENLVFAIFGNSILTGTEFTGANLANASFPGDVLSSTDFSQADLRGARYWSPVASTIAQNTILPDGSIQGLALGPNETLVIRNNAIPVTVQTFATFDPASTLQFQLDQNWTSPVGFAPGVTPAFNGTLDLEFASDVAPGSLLGTTFQLFNCNAPLAAGNQFATTTTAPGYTFNLSKLYTTGVATLTGVPAVTVGTAATPATMQLPSGVGLMTTSSLTINPGSTVDITNNALAINYTPGNSPAVAIRQWLTTGYANDTWTGPGIDSSVAALNPGRYAVGYADGNIDQGTAAGPNQVLVEYTLAGDANLDGTVNFADLLVVAQNFNHTLDTHGNPIDWADGDFNYDGVVNFADLLLVAQNFNQTLNAGQLEQLPGSFIAAWNLALAEVQSSQSDNVPEPVSAALLAAGAGLLLGRRRK